MAAQVLTVFGEQYNSSTSPLEERTQGIFIMQPSGLLHHDIRPFLAAISAACVMGLMGVFVRHISSAGETVAFARFALGFLFLVCSLLYSGRYRKLTYAHSIYPILSGVLLAFCVLFYVKAVKLTTLANAALLLYLGPLFAAVAGSTLLRERMTWINRLLVLSACAGSTLLIGLDFSGPSFRGNIYAAISAILYALFIVVNRLTPSRITPTTRSFYQLLVGAIVLIPFVDISADAGTRFYSNICWLVAMGFFQGFLSITLMIYSIEYLKTFQFSTIAYLEPVVASLAGVMLYDEAMSLRQGLGGLIILTSGIAQTLLSITGGKKPKEPEAHYG